MRTSWLTAAVLAAVVAAGCGSTGTDTSEADEVDRIRIGSFDFSESAVIAELYAQRLSAAGFDVEQLGQIGPREVVGPALEQGRIDLIPEYVGTAATYFGAASVDAPGLADALEARGLVLLEPAPAEDVNVFVVTEASARAHGLVSIGDLGPLAPTLRVGGPVECPDRPLCLAGLRSTYGLDFAAFVPQRNLAVTAEALLRGEVDLGVMFSTSAELSAGPFVILVDDLDLQPDENVVPIIRRDALGRWGSGVVSALDELSALLTTAALQGMNRSVDAGESVHDTAAAWLRSVGLMGT